jgi:hypothetical protein
MSRGNKRFKIMSVERNRGTPPRDLGSGSLRRQGFSGVWQRGVLELFLLLTRGVLVVHWLGNGRDRKVSARFYCLERKKNIGDVGMGVYLVNDGFFSRCYSCLSCAITPGRGAESPHGTSCHKDVCYCGREAMVTQVLNYDELSQEME